MTDRSEIEFEGAKIDYMSPALNLLNAELMTLCAFCPLARWYKRNGWKCFCSEFKELMYDEKAEIIAPVQVCDGRELEIMRLNDEAKKG